MKQIILIGFMGSGKSTIGKALADRLSLSFMDTDEAVEQQEHMSIPALFEKKGEAYFRQAETRLLRSLKENTTQNVISVGGGTVLKEENQELLRQAGTIFYLKMNPETAWKRLKNDKQRPLLQVENPKKKVEELLAVREGIYAGCADYIISVDGKGIKTVVQEIEAIVLGK